MLDQIGGDADPCIVGSETVKAPRRPLLPGEVVAPWVTPLASINLRKATAITTAAGA